jgi:hypothetical protein
MKLPVATLLVLPALTSAFIASQPPRASFVTEFRAASTFEEDLELTRDVIAKFMDAKEGKPEKKEEPAAASSDEEK